MNFNLVKKMFCAGIFLIRPTVCVREPCVFQHLTDVSISMKFWVKKLYLFYDMNVTYCYVDICLTILV